MIEEAIGQEILRYEVFEPWCMGANAKIGALPVFGALAVHTRQAVVTFSSRVRFSPLAKTADSSYGLVVSIMPTDAWALQRTRWLAHSASVGSRQLGWYSYPTHAPNDTPILPIQPGWKITDLSLHPDGQDAVRCSFDQASSPVTFAYRADFDGGICWAGSTTSAIQTIQTISPFLPEGEFAWLHPATKIEVRHPHGLMKSAVFEDWPLSLRRSVFGPQEAPNGEPLRRSTQLLRSSQLRSAYLDTVSELMKLRFSQHPMLARRLAARSAIVNPQDDFGGMVNDHWRAWLSNVEKCPLEIRSNSDEYSVTHPQHP